MQREGRRVLWVCDPMHGNTESTRNGFKTRRFDNIRSELDRSFDIHAALGSRLGGVHLELTGENVTECLGGARELTEVDLERAYRSTVDPRLNYEQSLEIAMLIVRKQAALAKPAQALDQGSTELRPAAPQGAVMLGRYCGGLRACVACSKA